MKSFLTLLVLAISTIFATVKSQNNQWSYYGPPHDCINESLNAPGLGIVTAVLSTGFDNGALIEVRDEMGRIIQQDQLKGGVGYIPLSTAQMKRGVYLCSVFFDGTHVSTEKIIKR